MNPRKPEPVQASPLTAHPEPVKLPLVLAVQEGLIEIQPGGSVVLTETGRRLRALFNQLNPDVEEG